jgi:hypothetical protein
MHVPINIPSLSMSTHHDVDMNKELIAHGYANLLGTCTVLCFRCCNACYREVHAWSAALLC